MVYLYYWDGKLSASPTKLHSNVDMLEKFNPWTHKIDATHGKTKCIERITKLVARNKKEPCESNHYHVLTNSTGLAEYVLNTCGTGVQCLMIWENEHWKGVTSETFRAAAIRDGKDWRETDEVKTTGRTL